jgi:hypothetical protein
MNIESFHRPQVMPVQSEAWQGIAAAIYEPHSDRNVYLRTSCDGGAAGDNLRLDVSANSIEERNLRPDQVSSLYDTATKLETAFEKYLNSEDSRQYWHGIALRTS